MVIRKLVTKLLSKLGVKSRKRTKLSERNELIKDLYKVGYKPSELAKMFGLTRQMIHLIVRRY